MGAPDGLFVTGDSEGTVVVGLSVRFTLGLLFGPASMVEGRLCASLTAIKERDPLALAAEKALVLIQRTCFERRGSLGADPLPLSVDNCVGPLLDCEALLGLDRFFLGFSMARRSDSLASFTCLVLSFSPRVKGSTGSCVVVGGSRAFDLERILKATGLEDTGGKDSATWLRCSDSLAFGFLAFFRLDFFDLACPLLPAGLLRAWAISFKWSSRAVRRT